MPTLQAYWRRFVESVIAFASKYRRDIFFRTGWNILLLQVGFVAALFGIVWSTFSLLHDATIATLIDAVTQSIVSGTSLDGLSVGDALDYEKKKYMVIAGSGILASAVLFSWLVTRMALRPTQNALESQKRFISNVAHELRTPLSIIKTNTEVRLLDQTIPLDSRAVHESNLEELNRISEIINNLLSMNALLRPERMEFKKISVRPIIERAVEVLSELAVARRVELTIADVSDIPVRANAAGLEQIITNIVKNAIVYTPAGGTVKIHAEPDYYGGKMRIRVVDTGAGIDEKDLAHIFEPFYRGDFARTRRAGSGSGLGLAIVAELLKLHGGTVEIESRLGKGTNVTVSLPLRGSRPPAASFGETPRELNLHLPFTRPE